MSTASLSNVFSDVYITGNCTVKGTISSLAGSITSQWTTSGSSIYYTTGNVGIGLTNPSSILNVNLSSSVANLYTTSTGSSASLFIVNTADSRRVFVGMDGTGLFAFSAGALALGTDNTPVIFAPNYSGGEKMRITTTGLVGIGTTNPGSTLTVSGAGSFGSGYQTYTAPTGGLIVQGNVGIGTSNPGVNALQVSGNVVTSGFTSNATNTVFNFDTLTVPFISSTQVLASSSVGIGTTNPLQTLHVNGALYLTSNPSNPGDTGSASFWNQGGVGPTISGYSIALQTNGTTERMRINSSGQVGIGTTNPGYLLHLNSTATGSSTTAAFLTPSLATGGVGNFIQIGTAITGYQAGAVGFLNYGANASNVLQLSINSVFASSININATGVGIGTTSPGSPLQIQCGDNYVQGISFSSAAAGAVGASDFMIQRGPSTNGVGGSTWNTSNCMIFHTPNEGVATAGPVGFLWMSSSSRLGMFYDVKNSRLGIGTTTPSSQLQVYGAGQATITAFNTTGNLGGSLILTDQNSSPYNGGALIFGTSQGNFAAIKGAIENGTSNSIGDLIFATRNGLTDTTLTTRMFISYGGNIGINTTSPNSKFQLTGDSAGGTGYGVALIDYPNSASSGGCLCIRNSAGGTGAFSSIVFETDGSTATVTGNNSSPTAFNQGNGFIYSQNNGTSNSSKMGFQCWNGSAETEYLALNWNSASGGLGVNIASCIWANPNSDSDARNYITNKDCNNPGTNADGRLNIQDRSSVYVRFIGGNNGTVTLYGTITQSGASTLYNASSDYRLKSNIVALTDGLTMINSLKPKTFTFNEYPTIVESGFIAHEVQEVIPNCVHGEKDAVNEDGSILPQGMDKSYMVTYLVAAVQQLSAKNADLEARLAALEAK